jgi:hypothetical protein
MTLADIRFGLVELLTSNSSINDIIAGRVFPVNMKQGETRDSIVYTRITEFEAYHMAGPSGLVSARFQFDCWSQSTDRAQVLADLVKEQLGGFAGQIVLDTNSPSANYVNVRGIFLVNGRDDYDSVTMMHRMSRDYFVWYADRNA